MEYTQRRLPKWLRQSMEGKIDLLYQQKPRSFEVPTSEGLLRIWSSSVYFAAILTGAKL
jgi:hypothetical protein